MKLFGVLPLVLNRCVRAAKVAEARPEAILWNLETLGPLAFHNSRRVTWIDSQR
jgi:hypothetical protein